MKTLIEELAEAMNGFFRGLTSDVYSRYILYTFTLREGKRMRTNIEIDDKLMKDVLKATGLRTKKEAVEFSLKTVLKVKSQQRIRELRGKLEWHGDLDKMRTDR